jgi:hypothetical protein
MLVVFQDLENEEKQKENNQKLFEQITSRLIKTQNALLNS